MNDAEQIVNELKKRFPPPYFERWSLCENWGGSLLAVVHVSGVAEDSDSRTVVAAAASTTEKLLAAVRSLPAPGPVDETKRSTLAEGRFTKGGHNEPNLSNQRPPAPGGSGGTGDATFSEREGFYGPGPVDELTALRAELAELREIAQQLVSSLREENSEFFPPSGNCTCLLCKALRAYLAWEAKHGS